MADAAILRTVVEAQTSAASAKLAAYGRNVDSLAGRATASLNKFGVSGGTAFAAVGAAAVAFGVSSVKAFEQSQRVMAQTQAVLKSTGGAAGVTAEQVTKLADSLSSQTGISDEAVQSTENLLLTFTKIGKDIFPAATRAVLDMATAMKGGAIPSQEELLKTAVQLGKALQDPVRGMTALRRVGVDFSAVQADTNKTLEETIKDLVATGDTAGATRRIIKELNTEFGGSASVDTFERRMAKVKNTIDNFQEAIGGGIVNAITNFMDTVEQAGKAVGFVVDRLLDLVLVQKQVTGSTDDSKKAIEDWLKSVGKQAFWTAILGQFKGFTGQIGKSVTVTDAAAQKALEHQQALQDEADAAAELARKIDDVKQSVEKSTGAFGELNFGTKATNIEMEKARARLSDAEAALADLQKKAHPAAGAIRDAGLAVRDAKNALAELREQGRVTMDDLIKVFDKQLKATRQWDRNVSILLARGLSPEHIQQFIDEMGANAPQALELLAQSSKKEFARVEQDMNRTDRTAQHTAEMINGVGTAIVTLPSGKTVRIDAKDNATHVIRTIQNEVANLIAQPKTIYIDAVARYSSALQLLTTSGGQAKGGVFPGYAAGVVTGGPQLASFAGGTAVVGEGRYNTRFGRGAEAVLPLNDSMMARLGRAIGEASGWGSRTSSSNSTPEEHTHYHFDVPTDQAVTKLDHLTTWRRRSRGYTGGPF